MKRKSSWIKIVIYLLVCSVLITFFCELGLRAVGYKPDAINDIPSLDCGGSIGVPHAIVGFVYQPGQFTCNVNGLAFILTIGKDSFRVSGSRPVPDTGKLVHLYGCSITWGHGLCDSATMAWKLQQLLPGARVKNYGIGAGSDVQALLLLKKNVAENNIPDVVVLNYGAFHDERNAMLAGWRKMWRNAMALDGKKGHSDKEFQMPFARMDEQGGLDIKYITARQIERTLPFIKHSALANLLNNAVENWKDIGVDKVKVSEKVIEEMSDICKEHHIRFVLAGIMEDDATNQIIANFRKQSYHAGSISVNLKDKEFNLMPFDGHPNERANEYYAAEIIKLIYSK